MEILNVEVPIEEGALAGFLDLPQGACALVAFVHGSGSSRFSRRNRSVAELLNRGRLATLRFDLLTDTEHARDRLSGELRHHIPLLTERVLAAVDWTRTDERTAGLPLGLFGSSTGAAAALGSAAERPDRVGAVVSRGGRPDLAEDRLERVQAPTLLVVGGLDREVLDLNRAAARRIPGAVLETIPGASHLFEEAGKLSWVAMIARDFFLRHLAGIDPGEGTNA